MGKYSYTRVWQIDHKLVVAKTVEEAVAVYKDYMDNSYGEPEIVRAISTTETTIKDFDALCPASFSKTSDKDNE